MKPKPTLAAVVLAAVLALLATGCATDPPTTASAVRATDEQPAEPAAVADGGQPTPGTEVDTGAEVDTGGEQAGTAADPTPSAVPDVADQSDQPDQSNQSARSGDSRGTRETATPVAGSVPDSASLDAALPLAATIAKLMRSWDDTNRGIFEADTTSFERVAAELEQVSAVTGDSGRQLFWAQLSDGGLLAGETNEAGNVTVVITIAGIDAERDRVVALTTLALFFADDQLALATDNYQEVLEADVGERETVTDNDLVAVIDRRAIGNGSVSIIVARGIAPETVEKTADALIGLLVAVAL